MPFTVQINVALRKRICQKIASERVKALVLFDLYQNVVSSIQFSLLSEQRAQY